MEESRYFILDTQSGELVRSLGDNLDNILGSGNVIYTRNQKEGIKEVRKVDYKYIKLNNKIGKRLYTECPQILLLIDYLSYKENSLIFPNGVYVNQTNLAKALGYSRVYVCQMFRELKRKRVLDTIKKNGKNIYVINPYIVTRGNEVYAEVLDKFNKTEWQMLLEEKGKRNDL